jgi:hypothetical protein
MKRVLVGFVIWTIAFYVGVGTANIFNRIMIRYLLVEGSKALNEAEETEVGRDLMSQSDLDLPRLDDTSSFKRHQFRLTYRACGFGYTQGYEDEDGQELREGVASAADNPYYGWGYRQRLQDARIRDFVANYPYRGRVGERYILENKPNDLGEGSVTILFYDGGDTYRFIDAPTLDLALEFEQYLRSSQ